MYLTPITFAQRTVAPAAAMTEVETQFPGWLQVQIDSMASLINARLAKRYAVPFPDPAPEQILSWLTRLVTVQLYFKRGFDPTDAQSAALVQDRDTVWAEIKEAADAQGGLFELPLRSDQSSGSAVRSPILYRSDPTPFERIDRQATRYRSRL